MNEEVDDGMMTTTEAERRRGEEAEVSKQQSTLSKRKNCGKDDGGNGALAIANDGDGGRQRRRRRAMAMAMAMAMDSMSDQNIFLLNPLHNYI
jgi:hypothetical protein